MDFEQAEKKKYGKVWDDIPGYRNNSPAVNMLDCIVTALKKKECGTVLDVGCGPGKSLQMLIEKGYDVTGVDITPGLVCLHDSKLKKNCVEAPAWNIPLKNRFDMVMSIDMLEHVPPEMLDKTLSECARLTGKCALFQIALFQECHGLHIDEVLHLSLHSLEEWVQKIKKHFSSVIVLDQNCARINLYCEV